MPQLDSPRIIFTETYPRSFLIDENIIDLAAEELKLACLCVDYLNLPALLDPPTEDKVLNGDYVFIDYAVLNWLRHLEAGAASRTDRHEALMKQLAESLEIYIEQHWWSPRGNLALAKRHSDKLQFFKAYHFYNEFELVVASTRKQLRFFGNMEEEDIALNLVEIVSNARKVLEQIVSTTTDGSIEQQIEQRYGSNLFKCPRFSCQFFTTGFSSAAEREKHIGKHDRPFRCADESCTGFIWGFASEAERAKHNKGVHFDAVAHDQEFPTDLDVRMSIQRSRTGLTINQQVQHTRDRTVEEEVSVETPDSPDSDPEARPQLRPWRKEPQLSEYPCPHCSKVYTKRYNLNSHLLSHGTTREHLCPDCGKEFARQNDLLRHSTTHTGEKKHVCYGTLKDGSTWGCGKAFARADTLARHHESRGGQACIQSRKQELEREQAQTHPQAET